MVGLDAAMVAMRSAVQIHMRSTATVTRLDGSTFTADRVKIERDVSYRSNDEQDSGPQDALAGMAYFPFDSEVRTGMRLQVAGGDVWYVIDDNHEETIRGTLEARIFRQDNASPVHQVQLYRQDMTGEWVSVAGSPFACQITYAGLMPTIVDNQGSRSRRVDVTLIGTGTFPARPGDMFAYSGLSGVVIDVQRPAVDRTEASCQIQRGRPG